jgi:hypothetical protein
MKQLSATSLTLLVGALSAGLASPSWAAEQSCSTLSVETDRLTRVRHPDLAERVQQAFSDRADVEPCARISLSLRQTAIEIEVALPDGRSALRSLDRAEDVVPTLEALLLVPESSSSRLSSPRLLPAAPASRPKPRPPSARQVTPREEDPVLDRGAALPADESGRSPFRIELSGALGVRAGDSRLGVGLGLSSFLQISSWLVGFQGRIDQYQGPDDGVGMIELGVLAGKRVDLDPVALDFVAGPAFTLQGTSTHSDVSVAADQERTMTEAERMELVEETPVTPRAFLGARLNFDAYSSFHAFLALDGDFALASNSDGALGAPELPAWTLGLSVGSTIGTP